MKPKIGDFVAPPDAEEMCGFRILEFEEALATGGLTPEEADILIPIHCMAVGRRKCIPE